MANKPTMPNVQKELLDAYEQMNRAWLARVKSEVDLWSELATKLTASRSIPEAMTAYQEFVTERMQMAAEDGRRSYDDYQKVTHKITDSLSHGLPTASS
jgi:hypothetical protein